MDGNVYTSRWKGAVIVWVTMLAFVCLVNVCGAAFFDYTAFLLYK